MPRLSCQGCRASHLLSACPWIAGHTCPTICWSDWCASSCDTMCYCIVCVCLRLHVTEFICSLLGRPDFWYEVCSMWTRCIHWWLHVHSTLHHLVTHQPFHDWHMWTLSSHLCTNSSMKYRVCCRQAKQKSIQHFCHDCIASIIIITGQRAFTAPEGAHRDYSCRLCNKAFAGQDANNIFWDGLSCWLYLVAHGKTPC